MKGFLEEYGLIIVVVAVVVIMLALGNTVGGEIKSAVINTVQNLLTSANAAAPGFIA